MTRLKANRLVTRTAEAIMLCHGIEIHQSTKGFTPRTQTTVLWCGRWVARAGQFDDWDCSYHTLNIAREAIVKHPPEGCTFDTTRARKVMRGFRHYRMTKRQLWAAWDNLKWREGLHA